MSQYANYNEITATPEKHLNFLRELNAQVNEGLGSRNSLYEKAAKSILVDGKPYSQAAHMNKLESHADGWDFDDVPDATKVEIYQLSEAIKAADSTFDLQHYTTGYEYMVDDMKDRGVDISTPVIKVVGGLDLSKAGTSGLETSADGLDNLFKREHVVKVSHEPMIAR